MLIVNTVLFVLFAEQQEMTQWVILEKGIEVEVYLSQNNPTLIPKSRLGNVIQRLRRSSVRQS